MFITNYLTMRWTLIMQNRRGKIARLMTINTSKIKEFGPTKGVFIAVGNKADWESWVLKKMKWRSSWRAMYAILTNDTIIWPYNAIVHLDEAIPHAHFNVVPTATVTKWLALQPSFRKALEQEGFGPSGRAIQSSFEMQKSIACMSLHEIELTEKLVRRTILRICEYKEAMEYIENRKQVRLLKCNVEEEVHEEKMELNERLGNNRRKT